MTGYGIQKPSLHLKTGSLDATVDTNVCILFFFFLQRTGIGPKERSRECVTFFQNPSSEADPRVGGPKKSRPP